MFQLGRTPTHVSIVALLKGLVCFSMPPYSRDCLGISLDISTLYLYSNIKEKEVIFGKLTIQSLLCYVSVAVIDCGSLEPPANGGVEFSDTVLGSQANYSCNPLFRLVGSETRICMENREWSSDAPTCERKYKTGVY